MRRRDLLKTGLATIGASTIALSGCSKTDNSSYESIIPKQTAQYEFSAPLPFNYKTIDEMIEFNSTIKKSQIKILHNNIPQPLVNKYNGWVHMTRGTDNKEIKTIQDFGQYVKYALKNGFEFTYLMNSPKAFSDRDFLTFKDDFLRLLDYLKEIGVKNIKVGCSQMINTINQYAPNEFNFQLSTCYEIHSIKQFENLYNLHPNFTFMDISHDENQNFGLLKSLRKEFPDKKVELMFNDGCPKNCPSRITRSCVRNCKVFNYDGKAGNFLIEIGSIHPWNFEYYSAIGINNFKYFVPGNIPGKTRSDFKDISDVKKILEIIENGYENYTWQDMHASYYHNPRIVNDKNKDIKLSEIAPLFPDIKHFIKYGDKCATRCGVECNYCYKCAKELEKALYLV